MTETWRTGFRFLLENIATEKKENNLTTLIIKMEILFARAINTAHASAVFLSTFSINLLAFYNECHPLIGYATHVLFYDR